MKPFRSVFNQMLQSTTSTPSAWAYRLLLGATGGSSLPVALMAMVIHSSDNPIRRGYFHS